MTPSEVPPCTETETKLLAIWTDVLDNPNIAVDDGFLELGGDSLSAMMCMSRITKTFGVEIPLEYFFMDDGTISKLAALINQYTDTPK